MALISNLKTPDDQTFDIRAGAIPFGEVDSTSTATAFTATVPGITELTSGTTVVLRNGVVTSASGFTININGLGAKPCYNNMATGNDVTPTNPTRDTTIFNINYTMLFVYQSDLVSGGAWICYRGYDANTNTIGYQLRTNSGNLVASDAGHRYRLWLTSADGTKWVPINTSTSTDATTSRTLNTRKIDPFGSIVYNSTNGTTNSGARPTATALWQQYAFTIGYSYVLSMTAWRPVYLKCTPQTDGSAVMNTLTQTLPSTNDGFIYIFLGIAYSATAMELNLHHPVYYYKDGAIRLWTNAEAGGGGAVDSVNGQTGTVVLDATDVGALPDTTTIPTKTSDLTNDSGFVTSSGVTGVTINTSAEPYYLPITNGNAKLDIGDGLSASDASNKVTLEHKTGAGWKHIPSGGSAGQFLGYSASGTATWQTPPTPTVPSAATANPLMDGTAAVGSSAKYAKEDHVHPTDTSRQATLVSGTNIKTINNESILGSGNIDIQGGGAQTTWYGTSSSTSSNAVKIVTVAEEGFALEVGSIISVFFYNGHNELYGTDPIELNINNTGAIPIYTEVGEVRVNNYSWGVYTTMTFMYDGHDYRLLTTNKPVKVVQNLTTGELIGSVNGTNLYAPSGGGGGGNAVTLYGTNILTNTSAIYYDSAKTESVLAHFDYDYTAYSEYLLGADSIRIVDGRSVYYPYQCYYDTGDDEIELFILYLSGNTVTSKRVYP